jgi:hypothetical protein
MTKAIALKTKIELGGHDISDSVTRLAIIAKPGDVYRVELDITDAPSVIEIAPKDVSHSKPTHRSFRNTKKSSIKIKGTDIAKWVTRYEEIKDADAPADIIRLYLHADSDVLTINDGHPWEESS